MMKGSTLSTMTTDQQRYLEFQLGTEHFGIPLLEVRELISIPETTPIPYTPKYIKGIMNLRGQVISVVDLRTKLAIKPNEVTNENAVVIVEFEGVILGLIVDAINRVIQAAPEQIKEIPEVKSETNKDYINGVFQNQNELTVLLNLKNLFNVKEISLAVQKAA
jgi:purine-binding chemotaxis protein CheW